MHEIALMGDIVQLVTEDAKQKGFARISAVALLVGDYSNALPDALEMAFLIYKQHVPMLADSTLEIEREEGAAECVFCKHVYKPDRKLSLCPQCGELGGRLTAGESFHILSYEGS